MFFEKDTKGKKILRLRIVLERTGLSRSTIYAMIKDGKFPPSFKISERCVGWFESDVDAWLENRLRNTKEPTPNAPRPVPALNSKKGVRYEKA